MAPLFSALFAGLAPDSALAADDAGADAAADADAGAHDAAADAAPSGPRLVISQVYGGGSLAGATLKRDYVEIFNPTKQSQVLSGLWLHYANAKGSFRDVQGDGGSDYQTLYFPKNGANDVSVPAGGYFLVATTVGADAGADLPDVDMEAPEGRQINLSATAGKLALVQGGTPLNCGGADEERCKSARIVDLVSYGEASDYEGSGPAAALDTTKAAVRNGNGCTDTDDNANDVTATRVGSGALLPRNSLTARRICGSTSGSTDEEPPASPGASKADAGKGAAAASGGDDGGCTLAPGWHPAGAGAALLLALGAMLVGRRRRRDKTRA